MPATAGNIALPIAYELVRKDILFSDVATRKVKRQSSINKNQMFRAIIAQAITNKVKFEYILADIWFGAKKNMEFIHYDMKNNYMSKSRTNPLIALSEEDKKNSKCQK